MHGQLLQADVLRGDEPPLAGDDLEPVAQGPDEDGLEDALGPDRIHELLDVSELAPGLVGVRVDLLDGDHPDPRPVRPGRDQVDEMIVMPHADGFREPGTLNFLHVR